MELRQPGVVWGGQPLTAQEVIGKLEDQADWAPATVKKKAQPEPQAALNLIGVLVAAPEEANGMHRPRHNA